MITEVAIVAALALIGGMAVRACGIESWGAAAVLSFPVGCAVFVLVGLVAVSLGVPAYPLVILAICLVGASIAGVIGGKSFGLPTFSGMGIGTVSSGLGAALVSGKGLVAVSPDSLHYVSIGSVLAKYGSPDLVPSDVLQRRGVAYPTLLSLGELAEGSYLHSLGPLLALTCLGVTAWIAWTGLRRSVVPLWRTLGVAAGVALLATNNRYIFNAWYLNGHLLFAVWLLTVCGLLWLVISGRVETGFANVVALVGPALAILRPEAGIVVLLAILPAVASNRLAPRHSATLLGGAGLSVALWHLHLGMKPGAGGIEIWGLLALGLILVGVSVLIGTKGFSVPQGAPAFAAIGLLCVLAVLVATDGRAFIESLSATVQNQIGGAGLYGRSLVLLTIVSIGVHSWRRFDGMAVLVFPIATAFPLGFVLAFLRETPYRVGHGDSLNRMLLHWVPVAVLALVAALESEPAWDTKKNNMEGVPDTPARPAVETSHRDPIESP